MLAILKRETKAFFTGMTGYVVVAVITVFMGIYYAANNLIYGSPDFAYTLNSTTIILLFALPALTMRSFADDRRNKTDQLLLTCPVGIPAIVCGKFLAQLAVLAVPALIACAMPLVLGAFGEVLLLPAYAAILAWFCMGAACIAVGTFVSSLTENQIIAYLATFGVLLAAYLMQGIQSLFTTSSALALVVFALALGGAAALVGSACRSTTVGCGVFCGGAAALALCFRLWPERLLTAFTALLDALAMFEPFRNFVGGMFDLTGLVYYLSVMVLFLFLTGQALEKRRWN